MQDRFDEEFEYYIRIFECFMQCNLAETTQLFAKPTRKNYLPNFYQ